MSLPFVHTARRSYRLSDSVNAKDFRKFARIVALRGRRSRNKVSVGEPAEGSLPQLRRLTILEIASGITQR